MRDVLEVLKEKQSLLIETRCYIEALKLVAPLLADDPPVETPLNIPEVEK